MFDLRELSRLLEATDPAALLVAPRLLRRIIKHDRGLTHLGLQVPHRKSYVIGREALLALASRAELGVSPQRVLPETVHLIAEPEPDVLAGQTRAQVLVGTWRLLFHAHVHVAIAARLAEQHVTQAALRRRIHQIGQTEFNEIRSVVRQEGYLLPPQDDRTTYEEFAALYLELNFFAAPLVPRYFPAIEDFSVIDQVLALDVDGAALFRATRLPGAPDPDFRIEDADREEAPGPIAHATMVWAGSDVKYHELAAVADRAAARGNSVRGAIYRARAAYVAPPVLHREAHELALAEISRLVDRLQRALNLSGSQAQAWRETLAVLQAPAAEGIWPPEAKLLYDLQKICIETERPSFAPDLVEWAYSGFRQPFLRPLPNQPLVRGVTHLRGAVARLTSVRWPNPTARRCLDCCTTPCVTPRYGCATAFGRHYARLFRESACVRKTYRMHSRRPSSLKSCSIALPSGAF